MCRSCRTSALSSVAVDVIDQIILAKLILEKFHASKFCPDALLAEGKAAENLEHSVAAVIAEGKNTTYDMKPTRDDPTAVGTSEYADAIIARLEELK